MKRNFKLIFWILIIGVISANAEDNLTEDFSVFNKGFSGQKQISDTKFKKTVKQMKERALSKKQKKLREQVQPNSPAIDEEYLKNFVNEQDEELNQTHTVMIPVRAYSDEGKYIQPGYYRLSCRKVSEGNYMLELSQGQTKVLSIKAYQTNQDLEQDTIQFCNAQVINDGRIRLMYGNINLNLVAYIYFDA